MTKKEGTEYGLTPIQSTSLQCESKCTCISTIRWQHVPCPSLRMLYSFTKASSITSRSLTLKGYTCIPYRNTWHPRFKLTIREGKVWSLLPGHGRQSIAHELYRAGGRHVETTHKLFCFIIRIRMFVQINLRHIKYKMTRLVWLTKCPYAPSATNTVNRRNSLNIIFSLRSSFLRGRPRFITTLHHLLKPKRHQIFTLKCSPSQESTNTVQDFQDQRSTCSDFAKHSTWTTLRHFGKMQIFPRKVVCKKIKTIKTAVQPNILL